ncbi:Phytocyanin domain [Arabidopsis thaliana x Arabidopsis arenosa]|uniref:Phytocyanin domain n=1 Tax=Arabidopsis thaliana x Arabidopsis arenosa TaxID=1240361 RepID=A0A8T2ACI7_9BRAS|nr:Phytocyanin domain [Arabidopsis thaliana x Arabidopsis arenosa]
MAMNGLSKMAVAAATALLLVLTIVPAAVAVTYTVGDAQQWDSGVDYTVWVAGKTFRVGDILEFKYGPSHSVDVVDKAGYDGCDASSSTENHSDGDTKIDLKTVGIKYFICPTPGHCVNGMKLAVTVVAASSGPPATPTPTPPSSTPGTPTTPDSPPAAGTPTTPKPDSGSTSPPPPKSSGASKGVMSYVLVGVSMVLGYGMWM